MPANDDPSHCSLAPFEKTAKGGAALYLLSLKRDDELRFGGEAVVSRWPVVKAGN